MTKIGQNFLGSLAVLTQTPAKTGGFGSKWELRRERGALFSRPGGSTGPGRKPDGPINRSSRRSLPSICISTELPQAAIGGISNSESQPPAKTKPCLGADHTKGFLSFEKQPSPFKGRNQSWFHPLKTPSRPGAAGPWTPWGAAVNRRFLRMPSTGRDAPTASCSVMRYYCLPNYFLRAGQGSFYQDGSDSSMEIPRLVPLARDDRQGKAPRPQAQGWSGKESFPGWYSGEPQCLTLLRPLPRNPGDPP